MGCRNHRFPKERVFLIKWSILHRMLGPSLLLHAASPIWEMLECEGNSMINFITFLEKTMPKFIDYLSRFGPYQLVGIGGLALYALAFSSA